MGKIRSNQFENKCDIIVIIATNIRTQNGIDPIFVGGDFLSERLRTQKFWTPFHIKMSTQPLDFLLQMSTRRLCLRIIVPKTTSLSSKGKRKRERERAMTTTCDDVVIGRNAGGEKK